MSNKRRYLGNYNAMYDAEADRCYPISKLPDWFKHDTWTNHQALCLFSNIEPSDSEIIWPDTFLERKIEVPEAQRVALLNEDPIFSLVPDPDPEGYAIEEAMQFIEVRREQGFTTTSKLHMVEFSHRMMHRYDAVKQLQTNWRIFYSNPSHTEFPSQSYLTF